MILGEDALDAELGLEEEKGVEVGEEAAEEFEVEDGLALAVVGEGAVGQEEEVAEDFAERVLLLVLEQGVDELLAAEELAQKHRRSKHFRFSFWKGNLLKVKRRTSRDKSL